MVKLTPNGVKINTNLVWTSHNTGGVEFNTGVFAVKCPGYFSAVGTQWSFSEITVAKPSLQRTFLMRFVSPIANQDILNQNWKMCFEVWAKRYFQKTQKSVHLYCYDSFKWRLHVFNSYDYCLVYVLLEDLNQISRTQKCHFAFYIFHEQKIPQFYK